MAQRLMTTLALVLTVLLHPVWANAESRALIALAANTDGRLEQALAAQKALKIRHGFDHVEVLTDATPGEIYYRMKVFLEGAGENGDGSITSLAGANRRFVWISGRNGRQAAGLCPVPQASKSPAIRPRYPSIVLAPDCLAETISLPPDSLTIRHSSPSLRRIARYFALPGRKPGMPTAVIALPGHSDTAVAQSDRAILTALIGAHGVAIRPLAFLQALRLRFPPASGPFVPNLRLSQWRVPFLSPLPLAARLPSPAGIEG